MPSPNEWCEGKKKIITQEKVPINALNAKDALLILPAASSEMGSSPGNGIVTTEIKGFKFAARDLESRHRSFYFL